MVTGVARWENDLGAVARGQEICPGETESGRISVGVGATAHVC